MVSNFFDVHPYLGNWSNLMWAYFSNGWLNHLTSYVSHHTIEVWGSGTHGGADPYRSLGRSTKLWSGYGGALWSFSGAGNSQGILGGYRGFLKWWYPQITHFNRVFHYKPSILGYHYFWTHPYENLYDSLIPWFFWIVLFLCFSWEMLCWRTMRFFPSWHF